MGIWDAIQDERKKEEEPDTPCPQEGGICPVCQLGTLAYNGKLELVCSQCGAAFNSGFT
jgi:predicted amidophosphoribosyltransferase